jgi:hypothetical protein
VVVRREIMPVKNRIFSCLVCIAFWSDAMRWVGTFLWGITLRPICGVLGNFLCPVRTIQSAQPPQVTVAGASDSMDGTFSQALPEWARKPCRGYGMLWGEHPIALCVTQNQHEFQNP